MALVVALGLNGASCVRPKPSAASLNWRTAVSLPRQCSSGCQQRRRAMRCRADPSVNSSQAGTSRQGASWEHVMLALLDNNPYLSDSSKQATQVAAQLASGRMTVLLVDEKQQDEHESVMRMNVITEQLHGGGCRDFEVVDSVAPSNASATCGEVADARGADLLVLAADAVHNKSVDANLLAEFVPCPIMLLP